MQIEEGVPVVQMDTVQDYRALLSLLSTDEIIVYSAANQDEAEGSPFTDRHLRYAINAGDTFYYACSDFSEFDLQDVHDLKEMFDLFGQIGFVAWSARDRQETPLKELMSEKYHEAYAYAAKFYAEQYPYVLLASEEHFRRIQSDLAGVGYTAKPLLDKPGVWVVQATLTEAQMNSIYYVNCIYRYYGGMRLKEVKFRYFNGWSVEYGRQVAAAQYGFTYGVCKGYYSV